ncbi:MAG: ABC transporter permease, partial [Prochlorothrix sp.]
AAAMVTEEDGKLVRTGLTTLGVFMGVAAVNATLQVRDISNAILQAELDQRVAPQILAYMYSKDGTDFQLDDLSFIKKRLPAVDAVSGLIWVDYGLALYQEQTQEISIEGVTPDILENLDQRILQGNFFSTADYEEYRAVVVVDQVLANALFQEDDPIGKRMFVANRPYTVVGVMETKRFYRGEEPNGTIWIPHTLALSMIGTRYINSLMVKPPSLDSIPAIQEELEILINNRYPNAEYIGTWSNSEDLVQQQQMLRMASRSLLAVGVIALIIGGVGITNITIASVVERTSEIGLRLALGATRQEILLQFVLEAIFLSLIGGGLAIISVHGVTIVVTNLFTLPYQFQSTTALTSLLSALAVGVGAVYVPAFRASRLDPVTALRL